MLDLRRLRLLRELDARGTIAAVAEALAYTPSAVSQQLTVLEREAGVSLLERAGRGVRLTDAARVLVAHAEVLLERAAIAEADLAAAAGDVAGRLRIAAFQSVSQRIAIPAIAALSERHPRLRCELIEGEPEESLPALALGDFDLVLADEWQEQPRPRPTTLTRHELFRDTVRVILPADHPLARRHRRAVPLAALAGAVWMTAERGMGWGDMTERVCRAVGGFEPDIRHRSNDADVVLRAVQHGLAVTMLPDLVRPGERAGVVVRDIEGHDLDRGIYLATRAADASRPSVRAGLEAVIAQARAVTGG